MNPFELSQFPALFLSLFDLFSRGGGGCQSPSLVCCKRKMLKDHISQVELGELLCMLTNSLELQAVVKNCSLISQILHKTLLLRSCFCENSVWLNVLCKCKLV